MRTIGIIQPNYIPWRGYFDFIQEVDAFVFLDDVQYTLRDWRSRNKIKRQNGEAVWLTVPVVGGRNQLIRDVRIDQSQKWSKKHIGAIRQEYGKTPFYDHYVATLEEHLEPGRFELLADMTIELTKAIAALLGLTTEFARSSELNVSGTKDDRLLAIVQALDGEAYLSGPAAADYIRPKLWSDANVQLSYKCYDGYPPYEQISEPFEPAVSVIDLMFMKGPEAGAYIWGERRLTA